MQAGFWRKCRVCVRWVRRVLLLAAVALICLFFWLDHMGVPAFLQRRLVDSLRARGIEIEFTRMRFSLVQGLMVDNARLGAPGGPSLSIERVNLEFDDSALLHCRLLLDGVTLRNGKFVLPLPPTNTLVLDKIRTELRFEPDDTWALDNFHAEFAGVQFALSGEIVHAPELRNWGIFRAPQVGQGATQAQLEQFADAVRKIHFLGAPQLDLNVIGNARDVHSFQVRLTVAAPAVQSPWVRARGLRLVAKLTAPSVPGNGGVSSGFWTNLQPYRLEWTGQAAEVGAGKFAAGTVACNGVWHWPELEVTRLSARHNAWRPDWEADSLDASATLAVPAAAPGPFDASWSWWTNAQPFRAAWSARLTGLKSDKLNADSISCGGYWSAPELAVTNFSAELGHGRLDARAQLNVATRELAFSNSARFDVHAVGGLFTEKTREWLEDFSWAQPPSLQVHGSLVCPAWTNLQPDWTGDVLPTLRLQGNLAFTNALILGVAIDTAASSFSCSNLVWRVPAATVAQSRTRLEISGGEDDVTGNYEGRVRGTFDPDCLRPLLTTSNAVRGLHHLALSQPVQLDTAVRGRVQEYHRLSAQGSVGCTNFAVRGVQVDSVAGDFSYSNLVIEFPHPRLFRGAQTMTADLVTLDFNRRLIVFTNGFSTAEPQAVATAIGPQTAALLEPYHFLAPPAVRVDGCAPLAVNGPQDTSAADLTFNIVGGVPFQCLRFHATRLTGTVRWLGQVLVLSNLLADMYGGTGAGGARFDFGVPGAGADYQANLTVTNVNLHALASDLWSPTNHLEGALSGGLVVTRADTRDWRDMDGFGRAQLRDGLIWDIPVFGMLNAVSPGLGNVHVTDARAQFVMTNGVLYSDNLGITAGMTRLQYNGTVDLNARVNAHVTAQLLRNVWVLGPLISTVFYPVTKVFEYRVTGTLEDPKEAPIFVPKVFLMPFHPIRTFEEMFSSGDAFTNAPAGGSTRTP